MYVYSELDDLRKEAPDGFYVIPPEEEERVQVIICGDPKSQTDWFAIFPDPRTRLRNEATLAKIVEERMRTINPP